MNSVMRNYAMGKLKGMDICLIVHDPVPRGSCFQILQDCFNLRISCFQNMLRSILWLPSKLLLAMACCECASGSVQQQL